MYFSPSRGAAPWAEAWRDCHGICRLNKNKKMKRRLVDKWINLSNCLEVDFPEHLRFLKHFWQILLQNNVVSGSLRRPPWHLQGFSDQLGDKLANPYLSYFPTINGLTASQTPLRSSWKILLRSLVLERVRAKARALNTGLPRGKGRHKIQDQFRQLFGERGKVCVVLFYFINLSGPCEKMSSDNGFLE